eukprot:COSAG06_NODE_16096_length_1022_cov_2.373781_1_plen_177_part_10
MGARHVPRRWSAGRGDWAGAPGAAAHARIVTQHQVVTNIYRDATARLPARRGWEQHGLSSAGSANRMSRLRSETAGTGRDRWQRREKWARARVGFKHTPDGADRFKCSGSDEQSSLSTTRRIFYLTSAELGICYGRRRPDGGRLVLPMDLVAPEARARAGRDARHGDAVFVRAPHRA